MEEGEVEAGPGHCHVDAPDLELIPAERVVDGEVEADALAAQEVLEGEVGDAVDVVEVAEDGGFVAALGGEPGDSAEELGGRLASEGELSVLAHEVVGGFFEGGVVFELVGKGRRVG